MRNNVLSVKNKSIKSDKGITKNEKSKNPSVVSNRTKFRALFGGSSLKWDKTFSSVTISPGKEDLITEKSQFLSPFATSDSTFGGSLTSLQYNITKIDFQEDLVSTQEQTESISITEGKFVPFAHCPLTSNGMWAHIPSNWFKIMSQILDIIDKAIKENNINVLFELQQSKKQFYEHLIERFIINFKETPVMRYSENPSLIEKGIKHIIDFGKDALSRQQLVACSHLKNPEFIYSLKGFSKGRKYEKAVKTLKNESFLHGLIGFMETLTADRKKAPSPGSDMKILHKLKKISKMDFLPNTIHSLLKFESAAQNEKNFINILEGPLMYGTSEFTDDIEPRHSFKPDDEYDDSDFSEFSEKFCEKTPERDTIAESVESDKTEDIEDFDDSFSEGSYDDVELFDISLNSKVYERPFQKTSVYRALKSTLMPKMLTEKDIQHKLLSTVKSNKPGLDSIQMEIVLQSSRPPSNDEFLLMEAMLNPKFALQKFNISEDIESIRNLSKSSSPDFLNFKMGLSDKHSTQKEEISRMSGVLGKVLKTNEDFLSSKNNKLKSSRSLSSLSRMFNQLSTKSFDSRPSILKNLIRSLPSIPESQLVKSSKKSGSITRQLFAESLNDPLFVNRTIIPESSDFKYTNKNKKSQASRESFKKTRKEKPSKVKKGSPSTSDNQTINLSKPSKTRSKNPFVSYKVVPEDVSSMDTQNSLKKTGKRSKDNGKKRHSKKTESVSEIKANIFMIKNKHGSSRVRRREFSILDFKNLRRHYRAFYRSVFLRNMKKLNTFGRLKCIQNKPEVTNDDKMRFVNRNYYFLKNWTWPMSAVSNFVLKPGDPKYGIKIVPENAQVDNSLLGKLLKTDHRRLEVQVNRHIITPIYNKKVFSSSPRTMTIFQPGIGKLNPFKIVYSLKTSHDKVCAIKPKKEKSNQTVSYVLPALFRVHITEPMKFYIDYQMLLKDYRYKSKCIPCIKDYERRNFRLKIGLLGNSNLANTSNAGNVNLINDLASRNKLERFISEEDWKLAIDSKSQEKENGIELVIENITTASVLVFPRLLKELAHVSTLTIHKDLFRRYLEKHFKLSFCVSSIVPELSVNLYLKRIMNCGTETVFDKAVIIFCDCKIYSLNWFDLDAFKINLSLARNANSICEISTKSLNEKGCKLIDDHRTSKEKKQNLLSTSDFMDNNSLLDALLKDFSIKSIRTQCKPEIPFILFTSNNDNRESSFSNDLVTSKFIEQNQNFKISIERGLSENLPFQRRTSRKRINREIRHAEVSMTQFVKEKFRRNKRHLSLKAFNLKPKGLFHFSNDKRMESKEILPKKIKKSFRDILQVHNPAKKSDIPHKTLCDTSRRHSEDPNLFNDFIQRNISKSNVNINMENKYLMNNQENFVFSGFENEEKFSNKITIRGKKSLRSYGKASTVTDQERESPLIFMSSGSLKPGSSELLKSLLQFSSCNYINNYTNKLINEKLIILLKRIIENEFVDLMIISFQNFQKLNIGKRISPSEIFCNTFSEIIRGISDSEIITDRSLEIYDNANDLKGFHRLRGNSLKNNYKMISIGRQSANKNCPMSFRKSKNQNCKDNNFNNENGFLAGTIKKAPMKNPKCLQLLNLNSIFLEFSVSKYLVEISERNLNGKLTNEIQNLSNWWMVSGLLDSKFETNKRIVLNPFKSFKLEPIANRLLNRVKQLKTIPTISSIKPLKSPKRVDRQIDKSWKFRKNIINNRFNTSPFEFDDFTNQNNYKTTKRKIPTDRENRNFKRETKPKSEKDSLLIQNIFNNIFKAIKLKEFLSYRNKVLRKRKKR